jgi:hypothetical protein
MRNGQQRRAILNGQQRRAILNVKQRPLEMASSAGQFLSVKRFVADSARLGEFFSFME